MFAHIAIATTKFARSRKLKTLIDDGQINFGGNKQLKIYGILQCASGKRLKIENRVFFVSEKEAIDFGYRPCGHCMKAANKIWKNELIQHRRNN